jgi:hypothetical protein
MEIRYVRSLLEYGFHGGRRKEVLNSEELAHLWSSDPIVVEQRERIKALAQDINVSWYIDTQRSMPGVADVANVICYRDNERVASFMVKRGPYLVFGDNTWFQCSSGHLNFLETMTDLRPLVLRADCADNLGRLMEYWSPRTGPAAQRPTDDEWNTWCDATISRSLPGLMPSEKKEYVAYVMSRFRCPAAGEGKCHYAANPDCKLDSPADTVFLFETKADWNQHGGPELFTFDNHNPRGGCVLFNNGTVKFLRTEKELNLLRWK